MTDFVTVTVKNTTIVQQYPWQSRATILPDLKWNNFCDILWPF